VKKVLVLVAAAVAAAILVAQTGAASGRSITLVSARATSSGIVVVHVRITGWKMYPALVGKQTNKPDGGHWHIFVDGKYNNFSANATVGKTLKLKAGWHTLQAELANDDHSELKPPVKSKTMRVHVP
jgi:hypothetical protein